MGRALRLIAAIVMLLMASLTPPRAFAAPGDTREEAEFLPLQNGRATWVGALNAGQARWFKLQPVESQPGAITLHLRPEHREAGRSVTAHLWIPVRTDRPLERLRTSAAVPSATTCPWRSRTIRSAYASASSR